MFQDTEGAEELSVKTLANMFEYKQGDPTTAKKVHNIKDMLTKITKCSEC